MCWNAATQTLHVSLYTEDPQNPHDDDLPLHLVLPHRSSSPHAVDALARALQREWGALHAAAGSVWQAGGQIYMQPLSLLTAQRAIALQTESPAAQPLVLPMHAGVEVNSSPYHQAVHDTRALLIHWLRQGLRHQGASLHARVQAQGSALQQVGLLHCVQLLRALPNHLHSQRPTGVLATLSTLGLLLGSF